MLSQMVQDSESVSFVWRTKEQQERAAEAVHNDLCLCMPPSGKKKERAQAIPASFPSGMLSFARVYVRSRLQT